MSDLKKLTPHSSEVSHPKIENQNKRRFPLGSPAITFLSKEKELASFKPFFKVATKISLLLMGICLADDIASGRVFPKRLGGKDLKDVVFPNSQAPNETHLPAQRQGFNARSSPCVIHVTPYNFNVVSGVCSEQELHDSYLKSEQLFKELQKELKDQGRILADQSNKKWGDQINKEEEERREEIRRRDNPTPEEAEEDQLEIDRMLDKKFQGWFGYKSTVNALPAEESGCSEEARIMKGQSISLPELASRPEINPLCKSHAELILGISPAARSEASSSAKMSEIKNKYRELARKYHPDKSPLKNADETFRLVNIAYKTLSSKLNRSR